MNEESPKSQTNSKRTTFLNQLNQSGEGNKTDGKLHSSSSHLSAELEDVDIDVIEEDKRSAMGLFESSSFGSMDQFFSGIGSPFSPKSPEYQVREPELIFEGEIGIRPKKKI